MDTHPAGGEVIPIAPKAYDRRWKALAVLSLALLILGLDNTILNIAVPSLQDEFDASSKTLQWIVDSYLLDFAGLLLTMGILGDRFGRKWALQAGLVLFGGASFCVLLVDSANQLIVVLGSGSPRGRVDPGDRVSRLRSRTVVDPACTSRARTPLRRIVDRGLLARDRISAFLGRRDPLARTARRRLWPAETPPRRIRRLHGRRSDRSAAVLSLFASAAALLSAFALTEARVRQPLVDLAFVGKRPFANANLCAFAAGYSIFVVLIVVPQLGAMPKASGYGFGYSTTKTGLLLVPMATVAMLFSWLAGHVVDRVGPRALMAVGSAVGMVGYVFAAVTHDTVAEIVILTTLVGVTFGVVFPAIASVVIRSPARDKTSIALGVNGVIRTTATAIAAAAAAALITGAGLVGRFPAEAGFTRAFVMGAIACGCGVAVAFLLPGRRAPRAEVS